MKNERIRRALQDAIAKPLEREGIECFGVTDAPEGKEIETVFKSEAPFFIAPKAATEDLGATVYVTTLQIVGVAFQEKNKWRFSDGISNTFSIVPDALGKDMQVFVGDIDLDKLREENDD